MSINISQRAGSGQILGEQNFAQELSSNPSEASPNKFPSAINPSNKTFRYLGYMLPGRHQQTRRSKHNISLDDQDSPALYYSTHNNLLSFCLSCIY